MSNGIKGDLAKIRRLIKYTAIIYKILFDEKTKGTMLDGIPMREQYLANALVDAKMLLLILENIEYLIPTQKE